MSLRKKMASFPESLKEGLERKVELAEKTTTQVGGRADWYWEGDSKEQARELVVWLAEQEIPFYLLGGGSNTIFGDGDYPGLVLHWKGTSLECSELQEDKVLVKAGAGWSWDALVTYCLSCGFYGLECLSGIPGLVGATPIQNVGAYGVEVGEFISQVHCLELESGTFRTFTQKECDFAYRHSFFKGEGRGRYWILEVEFLLSKFARSELRYEQLKNAFQEHKEPPDAWEVREKVLAIRNQKSMVFCRENPSSHSSGSFFLNPIISQERWEQIAEILKSRGCPRDLPRYPVEREGQIKTSAAFLIEQAGVKKGSTLGQAMISPDHVLAIANRGGAKTQEILALAEMVRDQVWEVFGLVLEPEPNFVGCGLQEIDRATQQTLW